MFKPAQHSFFILYRDNLRAMMMMFMMLIIMTMMMMMIIIKFNLTCDVCDVAQENS